MLKKLFIPIVLLIILCIGSWLRLGGVLSNSFAFTYDVGRDMLAVEDIVVNHNVSLIGQTTGVEGIFYGPWWYFILTIPFLISSGNPQGMAFFMGLVGIVTVLLSYFVGKKIGGIFLGIAFSALVSVSPSVISSSVQIWNPNLIPFFLVLVLLVLYSLFCDIKNKPYKLTGFLLLGILLGLIIDMEIVFGILFFLGIVISLIIVFKRKMRIKEIIFFLLGLILIFSPRIIFEIRHDYLMTKAFIGTFSGGLNLSDKFSFIDTFLNRVDSLFDLWNVVLAGQNSIFGFILLILVFFGALFSYKKIDKMQKRFLLTIFVVIITFLVGLTFFNQAVWSHYLVGLPIFYLLLISLIINMAKIVLKKSWVALFSLIIIFSVNLNPVQAINSIGNKLWEGNSAVYRNQLAVVDYVYNDANGENFKYIVYTPAVHDYSYRYLFSWYGANKYGYIPTQTNARLFYVILEPDYDLPLRLTNWLKNRESDGRVQKEKEVKGGIKVQTRIINNK